ncbi:hypothetical protein F5X99DRAFT_396837 [Biscogniauxia marginata]|nr:hypothetical protein F5X99DRAFT_396837 [Biscogniauxia marginata]
MAPYTTAKSKKGPSVPATPQMNAPYQPAADLPGLYPVHDGSYGVNTLINLDSAKKKGKKTKSGFANEDAEDKKFKKNVKKGGKQYGMETDLKKAVDKSKKEAENVPSTSGVNTGTQISSGTTQHPNSPDQDQNTAPPETAEPPATGGGPSNPPGGGNPPGSGNPPGGNPPGGGDPPDSGNANKFPTAPHVPKYAGPIFYDEGNDEPYLPYQHVGLAPANPYALVGNHHSSASPSDHAPFYGMPKGRGTLAPITPFRPDSSRSFNYESGLFGDASFQKPGMLPPTVPSHVPQPGPVSNGGSTHGPSQHTLETSIGANGNSNLATSSSSVVPPKSMSNNPLKGSMSNSYKTPAASKNWSSGSIGTTSNNGGINQGTTTSQGTNTNEETINQTVASNSATKSHKSATSKKGTTSSKGATSKKDFASNTGGININGSNKNNKNNIGGNNNGTNNNNNNNNDNNHGSSSWRGYYRMLARIPRLIKRLMLSDFIVSLLQLILVFMVILAGVWGAMSLVHHLATTSTDNFSDVSSSFSGSGLSWPDWGSIQDNIIQHIPFSGRGRTSSIFSDKTKSFWESDSPWVTNPQTAGGKSGSLVKDLENNLPEKIHVEVDKNGKPRISQDFWHAFRDQIKADDIILTLEEAKNRAPAISDTHWLAVKSRLEESGFSTPCKDSTGKPCVSAKDVDSLVENKLSQSWENWVRQNNHSLKQLVSGVAVTKDDFLKLFKVEAEAYQREIRAELEGLDARIKNLVKEASKLREVPVSPGGMTKPEVQALIEAAVAKAISSAKLDAIANGRIRGHASDMLFNQVNFFAIGAGAVIDPHLSSTAWEVPKHLYKSKKWLDSESYKPQPRRTVLLPWSEEGECFCAAPDLKGYGQGTNNISVLLTRNIIPQHLVVEHILPGSTLNPGAMPRDIEVWAYIEELNLRTEVQVFSQTQFPDTPREEILDEGWMKIGQFTYKNKHHGDGIQVFKISDELTRMGAITDHIMVRAINNYGADHTCFYRLRLYGTVDERPSDELAHS